MEKKRKIDTVVFDLDGTITDSGPGILNGVRYALGKNDMAVPEEAVLRSFIGPPLKEQFRDFCGISDEAAARMVSDYREYYSEKGIFENRVYDGVPELLEALKNEGVKVVMATSKPEKYAKIIAEHFGFAKYFDFIGGACMDGTRTDKRDVLEYALEKSGVSKRESTLMAGDRSYDIIGAHAVGIRAAGVLYGYGTYEELKQAGADFILETPEQLLKVL